MRPVSKKIDDLFCKLYNGERKAVSIETMKKALRERMQETFT